MATLPSNAELRGEVVYFYAFDVANEIRLDRAAELLAGRSTSFTARWGRPAPRSVPVSRPLVVEPTVSTVRVNGCPARLLVRVYDVGVISVTARVPFASDALAALIPFHNPSLHDGRPLDALAREQRDEVCRALNEALVRSGEMSAPEAYTVFTLSHLGDEKDANHWLTNREREVAGLLTETPGDRLSAAQVAEVLRLRRSFENSDLVVIDWDAALVVDLDREAEDMLFVIELANLQLEEFQWMDRQLDRYLDRAYYDLAKRPWWSFGAMGRILRQLRQLRVDLAKLADEVTHVTKFVGDWHLARVYLLARERFHLDQWRASVEQRLEEVDRLYTLTRGDVYERRMLWLEIIVVVFFAVDLLILLAK
ncbi:hypothetical protein VT84_12750 [Gemmata sp. SH-PL17]|uniref:hypothetical protein n=1 Tax=Gemmata sp. SH-PL17 TaxID=1630693 RepID=UPI0004B1D6B6|nr:hypothetical protein [Gemmata sp. SH-PL17]AMV25261.1 hypothetical protein VT84_12750 [Gemmata sp. SH-PL17]